MERELFDLIGASKANNKSDNFRDGKGRLLVLENIYEKMNDGPTFVGKFQVITAENKGDMELAPFIPGQPHNLIQPSRPAAPSAPGSIIGWPQKITKFKSAAGNVKAYILNLLGYKEADVPPQEFGTVLQQTTNNNPQMFKGVLQPARGMLVDFMTYRQMTRTGPNAGQINTYVNFITVPIGSDPNDVNSNHPMQIARRRAELDKTQPLKAS